MDMVDRVSKWEPVIVSVMSAVIAAALISVGTILWDVSTQVSKNTTKIANIAETQPRMTKKLNTIIAQMGGLQTKADAFRQHDRLRKRINSLDKRVTILEDHDAQSADTAK